LKENIHFMWLSAMSRPDHNTLNRFRSERLKGEVKAIFLDKYKKQQAILQARNSYSKTDTDATFMRMKPKVREFH